MSYNRTFYDKCAYDKSVQDSMKVGNYFLSTPVSGCNECYPAPPTVRLQKGGVSIYQDKSPKDLLIDIERDSELKRLKRKLSKCDDDGYKPCSQKLQYGTPCEDEKFKHYDPCFKPREDTRMSNPAMNLRGTGWNRFEWLWHNPQDNAIKEHPVHNRILAKDTFRPLVARPVNQTNVLPGSNIDMTYKVKPIHPDCAVPTQEPSSNWQKCQNIYQM